MKYTMKTKRKWFANPFRDKIIINPNPDCKNIFFKDILI